MPSVVACGSRKAAFDDFVDALDKGPKDVYKAMWIDSEQALRDINKAWQHLAERDGWTKPKGATDEQVLFMTTCMETLIVADRNALKDHFGANLQESALPPLAHLENRGRDDVQNRLIHATRECTNSYQKGKRSFEILAKLNPDTLQTHLPSFARTRRILNQKLKKLT